MGANGDGRLDPGCMAWCGAGWNCAGLVPEMTSEMDGRDWRAGASLSSPDLRGSAEEIMLDTLGVGPD